MLYRGPAAEKEHVLRHSASYLYMSLWKHELDVLTLVGKGAKHWLGRAHSCRNFLFTSVYLLC